MLTFSSVGSRFQTLGAAVFYPDTLGLGRKLPGLGGKMLGSQAPAGSRGRAPGQGSGGEAPRSWKLFAA